MTRTATTLASLLVFGSGTALAHVGDHGHFMAHHIVVPAALASLAGVAIVAIRRRRSGR
ncbi:MAG: hypothetical protein AAF830_02175 [Pseudomonadota bacterium]